MTLTMKSSPMMMVPVGAVVEACCYCWIDDVVVVEFCVLNYSGCRLSLCEMRWAIGFDVDESRSV